MERGYIKLWRKTIDSEAFADPVLFKLWCLCILSANHKENFVAIDGLSRPVQVLPGQFITGRFELHKTFYPRKKKTNISPVTLWRKLQTLQNMQNLIINSYSKYSIISICNWPVYQQNDHQLINRRSSTDHQLITNKNDKNDKNDKKEGIEDFDIFWAIYPKKKKKEDARKAFAVLVKNNNFPEVSVLVEAVKAQKNTNDWKKEGGQFIPHPATWLRSGSWQDEIHVNNLDGVVSQKTQRTIQNLMEADLK